MGLCASMLQRKTKNRHPETRRGTHKALFVIRNERRPSKPRNPDGSGYQKPGKAEAYSRKHEKCSYDCTDVLGKRLCIPMPRLPCGSRGSVAVEPVAPTQRESVFKDTITERSTKEGCRTPMTPWRTPVWQRRILMGARCELPRFNDLILYDERGRPLQSSTKGRAGHHMSRTPKSESKDKKKTTRTTTTVSLRDLM